MALDYIAVQDRVRTVMELVLAGDERGLSKIRGIPARYGPGLGRTVYSQTLRRVAEAVVPGGWKWDVIETVDGKASFHITGYDPELEE